MGRLGLAGRLHRGRVRPLPGYRAALGSGRHSPLQLLPQAFPLVLGTATAPDARAPRCRSSRRWPIPDWTKARYSCAFADADADRPPSALALLLADKGSNFTELDYNLHARGAELLRPAYRNRAARPGQALLARIYQRIESVHAFLRPARPRITGRAQPLRGYQPHRPTSARTHRWPLIPSGLFS